MMRFYALISNPWKFKLVSCKLSNEQFEKSSKEDIEPFGVPLNQSKVAPRNVLTKILQCTLFKP